jgi:hypothetical protein
MRTIAIATLASIAIAGAAVTPAFADDSAAAPRLHGEICLTEPAVKDIVGSGAKNSLGFSCDGLPGEMVTIPELYQRGYRVAHIWEQVAERRLGSEPVYTAWAILIERQR